MDALLVIDVQCGMFADPAMQPHDGDAIVGRIAALIDAARTAGKPIIFVQHDGGVGDVLSRDEPGFALRPELAHREGDPVVVKRFCSAFQETELTSLLAMRGINRVAICGMQTEYCIDTSFRSAFEHGLAVTLIGDGHTTFDSGVMAAKTIIEHHNVTLDGGFVAVRLAEEVRFGVGAAKTGSSSVPLRGQQA